MKKKLSLLMVALVAVAAFAVQHVVQQVAKRAPSEQSFTITFKDSGKENDGSARRSTIDDIIASGEEYVSAIANAESVYNGSSGRGLKFGTSSKAGTLVMTLAEPVKPTKIVFKARAYNPSETSITVNTLDVTELTLDIDEYTVNYDGNTEISKISISTPAKRAYITEVKVYYMWEAPAVAKPVISGETPFYGSTQVTLTCATEGASIYYTLDGTEPTDASTPYVEAITLTETTTVKAIAKKGDDLSAVAENTFTLGTSVATLEAMNALANNTKFMYTGELLATYVNGAYCYVKDNAGVSLLYQNIPDGVVTGKTINANWIGTVSIYQGLFEVKPDAGQLSAKDGDPVAVTYDKVESVTAADVNKIVVLQGVKAYTAFKKYKGDDGDARAFTITLKDDSELAGFNRFMEDTEASAAGETYDITGAVAVNGETVQFWPISISKCYAVNVADEITGGTVTADPISASAGTEVTLTATPAEGYKLLKYIVKNGEEDVAVSGGKFTMPAGDVTVSAIFAIPEDITVEPATGADIYEALVAATTGAGKIAKSVTINLAKDGAYTLTSTIKAPAVTINGNGATIDASAGDNIVGIEGVDEFAPKNDETPSDHYFVKAVTFKDVTITGMKKALIRDLMTKTLLETLTIENCVMQASDGKPFIDFDGRGYVGKVVVKNSTIWAAAGTNKNFAKYGSRPKNVNEALTQEFDIQNSTIVNIASKEDFSGGQNFNNLKQNGTAQNVYTVKNNIFVNCGKSGQVIVGLNNGQTSATPVWDVDGNAFNWNGADVCATEISKAGMKNEEDIVKNSVAAVVAFKDAANGDFTQGTAKVGDPRWIAYTITKAAEIANGDVEVSPTSATAGTEVTLTATPAAEYMLDKFVVTYQDGETTKEVAVANGKFTMPAADVTVGAIFRLIPVDVTIAASEITEGDITAAIATKAAGKPVKDLTITLAENTAYSVTAPIVAGGNVVINGNGATIDASALAGNFIEMAVVENPTEWTEANVTVKELTVKGLKMALFYSACKKYFGDVTVDKCVVEQAADATTFDYTKGSTAVNFTVTNSTFYAPAATTKSFYSSQGGQKTTEYNDEAVQTFTFTNNTMYNLALGKNFFTHRQSNQKWLAYNVKNNIFVNCGKGGQTIKGMNGGQGGMNPTWTIDGNLFNFEVDGVMTDKSADEDTGDAEEPVKNSIAGIVTFTDAAAGDFNGTIVLGDGVAEPSTMPGDPRWKVEVPAEDIEIAASDIIDGDLTAAIVAATTGKKVGNITITLAAETQYTVSAPIVAPANVVINGNGATIDASALEGNMIEFAAKAAEDTEWTNADVAITAVTVKGLKKALFYSNSKYYYGNFTLINSFIEQAADATTFDYTKGSVALNFTIAGSTIYAPTATTKSLYSSQSGQKATEYNADATQNFLFSLNTMYNLAKGKNFFTHRQNSQKWLTYDVKNNIFVNCGKSGQTIKGLNGGSSSANPTWTIKGNAFNFDGADTSANEETGDADHTQDETPGLNETVQDNVAGVMTFTNVETPDFGGTFEMPFGATAPEALGDNRWTITFTNAPEKFAITKTATENGSFVVKAGETEVTEAAEGTEITIIATPAEGYELEAITVKDADGADVTVTDGKFTMPAKAVTVSATFKDKRIVYDFAAEQALIAAGTVEKPGHRNGNQNNGQGFNAYSVKIRNDYKGYVKKEGSTLPETCNIWRRSDRFDQDASWNVEGGVNMPNDREFAIDGLTPGSKVVIEYDATNASEIIWAVGENNKLGEAVGAGEGIPVTTATIGGVEAVPNETAIASGAEILIKSVTPAVKGTGYMVIKVKKNTIISKISILVNEDAVSNAVTVADGIENGTVKVNRTTAYEGDDVYVTATPAEGYELEAITVKDADGADVTVTDGKFTMPAKAVTVSATFKNATGINSIAADKLENATIYTISGQRVEKAQKGLYIINGKKVVIK